MFRIVLLGTAMLCFGCSAKPTVSEHQCRAGDWQTVGLRDGSNGLPQTQLLHHQEACGDYGIVPERNAYLSGWQEGLANYCTEDNGFELGKRGARHQNVCRTPLFQEAYNDGQRLYAAQQAVRSLERKIERAEERLTTIRQEIVGATTAQLVPDLTVEERVGLVAKLEALLDERGELEYHMPFLYDELAHSKQVLEQLDLDLAYAH